MYRRIVVPLDGSDVAEAALPQAEGLAKLTGAPLLLLRVIDISRLDRYGGYGMAFDVTVYDGLIEEERTSAGAYLEQVRQAVAGRGAQAETELREGPAAREILAATDDGDLVAMASHGRGGLARWFMGSVAEDVVRRASVPVLLVHALPEAATAGTSAGDAVAAVPAAG